MTQEKTRSELLILSCAQGCLRTMLFEDPSLTGAEGCTWYMYVQSISKREQSSQKVSEAALRHQPCARAPGPHAAEEKEAG